MKRRRQPLMVVLRVVLQDSLYETCTNASFKIWIPNQGSMTSKHSWRTKQQQRWDGSLKQRREAMRSLLSAIILICYVRSIPTNLGEQASQTIYKENRISVAVKWIGLIGIHLIWPSIELLIVRDRRDWVCFVLVFVDLRHAHKIWAFIAVQAIEGLIHWIFCFSSSLNKQSKASENPQWWSDLGLWRRNVRIYEQFLFWDKESTAAASVRPQSTLDHCSTSFWYQCIVFWVTFVGASSGTTSVSQPITASMFNGESPTITSHFEASNVSSIGLRSSNNVIGHGVEWHCSEFLMPVVVVLVANSNKQSTEPSMRKIGP